MAPSPPLKSNVGNVAVWLLNVIACVGIVFLNKALMDPRHGCGFTFATTLSAVHFLSCGALLRLFGIGTATEKGHLPREDMLSFSAVASVSIAALNISLLLNSTGFYQVAKLTCIPCVCLMEYLQTGKTFTPRTVAAMAAVVVGAGVVTVSDVSTTVLGTIIAVISVVTSSAQQIMCGSLQRQHRMSSTVLLAVTAPVQGAMLALCAAPIDKAISGNYVWNYIFTLPASVLMAGSCTAAVLVNLSQFMCLGRFSAATFQVMGHVKTFCVLIIGWAFLGDQVSLKKAMGMALAVGGMIAYTYFSSADAPPAPTVVQLVPSSGDGSNTDDGAGSMTPLLAKDAHKSAA